MGVRWIRPVPWAKTASHGTDPSHPGSWGPAFRRRQRTQSRGNGCAGRVSTSPTGRTIETAIATSVRVSRKHSTRPETPDYSATGFPEIAPLPDLEQGHPERTNSANRQKAPETPKWHRSALYHPSGHARGMGALRRCLPQGQAKKLLRKSLPAGDHSHHQPKQVGAVKSAQISNKLTTSNVRRLYVDAFTQEVNRSLQSADIAGISCD